MKIAIIGAGGAGLTTAWLLDDVHEVTLFEKERRLGGHAHTINIEVEGKPVALDGGFEFFSDTQFPTYMRLLNLLHVPISPFPMLVTQYHTRTGDLIMLPPVHGMRPYFASLTPKKIQHLLSFQRVLSALDNIMVSKNTSVTVREFCDDLALSQTFRNEFFYPFCQAGWGVTREDIETFIIYDVMRYSYLNKPTGIVPKGWKEIDGGTQTYVNALVSDCKHISIRQGCEITALQREADGRYLVIADGHAEKYDHVVLVTNPNQPPAIIQQLPDTEKQCEWLNSIEYFETTIALHSDTRLMPPNRKHWSTVNIRYDETYSQFSIWKHWKSAKPVFKSWVTHEEQLPSDVYATAVYLHPKVDRRYFSAQRELQSFQGKANIWLAGMYMFDIDCHESAVSSAINVVKQIAPDAPRLEYFLD